MSSASRPTSGVSPRSSDAARRVPTRQLPNWLVRLVALRDATAQQITPEIHKIPSVVSNSVLVPTNGLQMQDDHHFNFEGHKVWTQRVLDLMKMKGWAPWLP